MKPPLPPEARRPMSPTRALSPAPMSPSTGVRGMKRDGRKLSRQLSDHPHQRHNSPPAWFHPIKPTTPPPAPSTCQVMKTCSTNQQDMIQEPEIECHHETGPSSSTANEDIISMIESLDDLSVSMSASIPARPPSPTPVPFQEKTWIPILRPKKIQDSVQSTFSRPVSVPAFSLFRKKDQGVGDSSKNAKETPRRPTSLQPRSTTPTNHLRPISPPPPRRGATSHDAQRIKSESESCLIHRPEPRLATDGIFPPVPLTSSCTSLSPSPSPSILFHPEAD